jgi:hypothetical protein
MHAACGHAADAENVWSPQGGACIRAVEAAPMYSRLNEHLEGGRAQLCALAMIIHGKTATTVTMVRRFAA